MTRPTDAELLAEWDRVSHIADAGQRRLACLRAVLAKWGTPPAVAGEAAEHYRNAIASACEGWTMPDGLRKHLETALWSPPTQAAPPAGREPLTDAQIRAMLNKHPPEDVCGWSYRMGIDDAELHHDIKGCQHGAE